MSDDELIQKMEEVYRELFNLRQQQAIGKGVLERPHRIRMLKKTLARIKTLLTERYLLRSA
ncbi:MAG: 50S ribosomal protein L29 [Armatimonadetes bacterium]|nr:50S ribosomal protein L29 [Armatimonadota bacterium]MDW8121167.1 50S ribosomal protein L29 [Armatimonadota bacterium]